MIDKQFKCRASASIVLTTEPQGKSPKQLYNEACEKIEYYEKQYSDLKTKDGVRGNGYLQKIKDYKLIQLANKPLIDKPYLSQTLITHLTKWVVEQLTGKRKVIKSKYFDKGNAVEGAVLKRASNYFGVEFKKNTERKENEFFTGEWDASARGIVLDVKGCWDQTTMPYTVVRSEPKYYSQLNVYMDLLELDKAALFYGLENAPEEMINDRAWQIAKADNKAIESGECEMTLEHYDQAHEEMTFDNLPDWMRQKVYIFERDQELIDSMKSRVIECREVIKSDILPQFEQLKNEFNNRVK